MTEHETPPPLFVEQALVQTTEEYFNRRSEVESDDGLQYPARLGSLAVERLCFNADLDAGRIIKGVEADFEASYNVANAEAARTVRQRSIAWLDWLSQDTDLNVYHYVYPKLAFTAAKQGDAETVRQIVENPKRLWLEKHAGIPINDPNGQLDRLSIDSMGEKITGLAGIMAVASGKDAEQVRSVIMPIFRDLVTEFVSHDVIDKAGPITWTSDHLSTVGTPDALMQLDKLVAALPLTPAKLDVLAKLALKDKHFAGLSLEARAWYKSKISLAQKALKRRMKPYGMVRTTIDYPVKPTGEKDVSASRPIAAKIVEQIPNGSGTSAIETSVAYASGSKFGGSIHGSILQCVRTLTGNAQFQFANPAFGFGARFEDDKRSHAQGQVTVIDENLPDGRIVIDLSSQTFRYGHDDTRFLCHIIQAEKDRRRR